MRCQELGYMAQAWVSTVWAFLCVGGPAWADDTAQLSASVDKRTFVTGREAISKAIETRIAIHANDKPFREVVALVEDQTHVRMLLHRSVLKSCGVIQETPVSLDVTDVPAREALTPLLQKCGLAMLLCENHVLITTAEVADARLETATFDVTDLVMHQDGSGKWYESSEELVTKVMFVIRPASWGEVGGAGSIKACALPLSTVLVCLQTQEVQREVAALLADLRRVEASRRGLARLPMPSPYDMLHRYQVRNRAWITEPAPIRSELVSENEYLTLVASQASFLGWSVFPLLRSRSDENLVFSPAGMALPLGLLLAGAQNATAEELAATLHLTNSRGDRTQWILPDSEVTPAFAALFQSLRAERVTHGYELRIATKLWRRSGQSCAPAFLECAKLLGVEVEHGSNMGREEFMRSVNAWTADKTRGTIEAKSSGTEAEQGNGAILKNAMHFHGAWQKRFAAEATRPAPFRSGKRTWSVPMMNSQDVLRYREIEGSQVLEIPYQGGAVSMVVVLPRDEAAGLETVEKQLFPFYVNRRSSLFRSVEVDLYLPRFRITQQHALKGPLMELGLATTFDRNRANCKGIDALVALYLESYDHCATVVVNEEGMEPNSVTGKRLGTLDAPLSLPKPITFRADHPFLFLLRDVRTGDILFIGRYAVPTETAKAGS